MIRRNAIETGVHVLTSLDTAGALATSLENRAKELTLIDIAKIKPVTYNAIERVEKFLKDAGTYYLATTEGDQPRVRPFGTAHIFEDKLYIQTGKVKDVSKQLHANPKAEITAFKDGEWIRVTGELVEDDRRDARESMLNAYPPYGVCILRMMEIPRYSTLRMRPQPFPRSRMHRKCLNFK